MTEKEEAKLLKNKKMKEAEMPKILATPQKREIQPNRTPNLQDLSPYSPVYRTIKISYDTNAAQCDLAIIETPMNATAPRSFI